MKQWCGFLLVTAACVAEEGGTWTRLMRAAASGEAHSVRAFLEEGHDPNEADSRGVTPLALAAQFGRTEIVSMLLEGGAEVDVADESGRTPLMKAARLGQAGTVDVLLDAGADPAARDEDYRTASDLAEAAGYRDIARRLRAPNDPR